MDDANLAKLEAILDRQVHIDALSALASAVTARSKDAHDLKSIAFGFDANVLLRVGQHRYRDDIVDYLDGQHTGPLIVPGQAVQEFWNNQLSVIDTAATKLKKSYDAFSGEASKLITDFGDFGGRFSDLLQTFSAEHGHVYEETVLRNLTSVIEMLQRKAVLSFVPRSRFCEIAHQRKRTKTPPGFKDEGDGDFFIWVDFLYGLLIAADQGKKHEHVVLVTLDKKLDWSREGVAHPILIAELKALVDSSFEVWTLEKFANAIRRDISPEGQ